MDFLNTTLELSLTPSRVYSLYAEQVTSGENNKAEEKKMKYWHVHETVD